MVGLLARGFVFEDVSQAAFDAAAQVLVVEHDRLVGDHDDTDDGEDVLEHSVLLRVA